MMNLLFYFYKLKKKKKILFNENLFKYSIQCILKQSLRHTYIFLIGIFYETYIK